MDVRRMFNKVLQSWAMDVLALKRKGLDRPSVREPTPLELGPGGATRKAA